MDLFIKLCVVISALSIIPCHSDHFRGGTISWKPTGNTNEVISAKINNFILLKEILKNLSMKAHSYMKVKIFVINKRIKDESSLSERPKDIIQ